MKLIYCKNKEESDAVLQKLENQGVVWFSGQKPTQHGYYEEGMEFRDKVITCHLPGFESTPSIISYITAEEFLRDNKIEIIQCNNGEIKKIIYE